jgi:15-cis-phytoene synthase
MSKDVCTPSAATQPPNRGGDQPSIRGGNNEMAADRSTFAPALRLLPGDLKDDVQRLYRILRTLDDLVDEDDPQAANRVEAVERWARGKQSDTPETRMLADLSQRYPLPRAALLDFCEGMRHDIARMSIDTEEDFARYCLQAGGSVGILLATMLGTSHPDGETKMATLGRAMQVTNILRDIDEDLTHGRLYIPRSTIERFGFPAPGAREALLRDQIARADALYEEGAGALPLLQAGRRAMALSATLYREILRQIERDDLGRRSGRAIVPAWRMRMLTAKHRLTIT